MSRYVKSLGLDHFVSRVFNAAEMGYEKPHPLAFRSVLNCIAGAEAAWMIDDNIVADALGAEAVGIPAVLVRNFHPEQLASVRAWSNSPR